jgi:hypothetical protein
MACLNIFYDPGRSSMDVLTATTTMLEVYSPGDALAQIDRRMEVA